jgi:uncharacterized protein YjbJ (UPF0337 family)
MTMDQNRVEGAARTVAGKVEGVVGDITGDTKTQVEGLADRVTGKAQRAYGDAKDKAQAATRDYGAGLMDQVEEYGDALAEKIDQRPITTVLIAAGIGLLFALITKPSTKVVYRNR